jgi:hypothetical protein
MITVEYNGKFENKGPTRFKFVFEKIDDRIVKRLIIR